MNTNKQVYAWQTITAVVFEREKKRIKSYVVSVKLKLPWRRFHLADQLMETRHDATGIALQARAARRKRGKNLKCDERKMGE